MQAEFWISCRTHEKKVKHGISLHHHKDVFRSDWNMFLKEKASQFSIKKKIPPPKKKGAIYVVTEFEK